MTGILMSYIATSVATAPIVIPPVGYKYWRINNIRVTTGYLEISEIQFFSDSTKINGIMTSSVAPAFGTVNSLNDGLLNNRCYWTQNTVETSSFWIQMEFASTQNINGIKFGGWDEALRYPKEFSLQYSQDGIIWTTVGFAVELSYPGNYTLSNTISVVPDPYYSSVALLLNMTGNNGSTTFIDNAPIPGSYTAFGSANISTAQFIYGTSSAYFDGTTGSSIRRSSMITIPSNQNWTMEGWFRPSESSRLNTLNGITVRGNSGSINTVIALDFYNPDASKRRHIFGGINQSGTANIINTGASFGVIANTWYYYMITNDVGANQIKLNIGAAGSNLQEFSNSGVKNLTLNDIGCYQGSSLNGFDDAFFGYIGPTRLTVGIARTPTIPTDLFPIT